jgi:UDP-N-acetylmuramyl pentapeptide phosphotransferase/UDP-N-acetylglucosamine-1-phosphate transferase
MTHSAPTLTCLLELGGIIFLAASAISYFLLLSLKSTLRRYALTKPNARSSHRLPTPQGGGIAVIAATAAVTGAAAM